MIRYGIMNQVAHITQMLSFRLSYYVLDHYHGEAAVGVYSNGISLAESIWMISKSISLVQYARISNTRERSEAAKLTVRLIKFSVAASLIILIPLMLVPSSFYTFLHPHRALFFRDGSLPGQRFGLHHRAHCISNPLLLINPVVRYGRCRICHFTFLPGHHHYPNGPVQQGVQDMV